jgi:hypothetical protein
MVMCLPSTAASFRNGLLKRRCVMPRYYFTITYPGGYIQDRYGHELSNLTAAQDQALHFAQRMRGQGQHWHQAILHIISEGQELASVPFSVGGKHFP